MLIQRELDGARDLWKKNLMPITKLTSLEREATGLRGERAQLIAQCKLRGRSRRSGISAAFNTYPVATLEFNLESCPTCELPSDAAPVALPAWHPVSLVPPRPRRVRRSALGQRSAQVGDR